MIDTHCHLTFDGLHERVEEVVATAGQAGVDRMISVGVTPADAARAIALRQRFANVYATAGLHPHYAAQYQDKAALQQAIRAFAAAGAIVALGEMGLDKHYDDPPLAQQRRAFAWQLELAHELAHLPWIIHNREATDETLAMIRDSGLAGSRFVFHCFTGSAQELEQILELGAMVSLTGIVTFNSARELAKASDMIPLERLMIETDSPFLTPEPFRKVRPNEPRYVAEVARFLADRRGMPLAAFVAAVDGNAERFFGLPIQGNKN